MEGDLAEIKKRGVLRVLVQDSDSDPLPIPGVVGEQEHELVKDFSTHLGVEAQFVSLADDREMLATLANQRADLIASPVPITKETTHKGIAYSHPVASNPPLAWAVQANATELLLRVNNFLTEKALTQRNTLYPHKGDVDEIRSRGVLRVLTRNSGVSYFLYRGQPMGFDYDVAKMLAKKLGVGIEMVVAPSNEMLIPWLLQGRGDIIAASFGITPARARHVFFSKPYLNANPYLVADADIQNTQGLPKLTDQTIHVPIDSVYSGYIESNQHSYGCFIEKVEPPSDTQDLVRMVAEKKIKYTVTDEHIIEMFDDAKNISIFKMPPGKYGSIRIAFAMRPSNPELRNSVNHFVDSIQKTAEFNILRTRYQRKNGPENTQKNGHTYVAGQISPYDNIIKKYARKYNIDWRLMAAQAFHESKFRPRAVSWAGALGLFQVLPKTGAELGFHNLTDPEIGVHAGIQYMTNLMNRLPHRIEFPSRVRMALAAFNAGMGHLEDARRLAQQKGLDPDIWFGNVEKVMPLLADPVHYMRSRYGYCRGTEPVQYVSRIQTTYEQYVQVFK